MIGKMQRSVLRKVLIGALIIVAAGTLTIPFVYESQTLWYKLGVDKTFLRAGQLLGLLAFLALSIQIVLGARGKVLEETFGVAPLVFWHKMNGIVLFVLAALHILLVILPEGIANLPIGMKSWPEIVGGVLFMLLFCQVFFSLFRQQLRFIYKQWRMMHRSLGYLSLVLAAVHVLFVADSFAQGVPRIALLIIAASVFARIVCVKILIKHEKIKQSR